MDGAEWDLRVQLACAFRINAYLGWEDAINTHTSMRVPGPKHHFLLNPFGLRFDEIKASDLVKVDQEGQIIGGATDNPLNEAGFVIHSARHQLRIHRQRQRTQQRVQRARVGRPRARNSRAHAPAPCENLDRGEMRFGL